MNLKRTFPFPERNMIELVVPMRSRSCRGGGSGSGFPPVSLRQPPMNMSDDLESRRSTFGCFKRFRADALRRLASDTNRDSDIVLTLHAYSLTASPIEVDVLENLRIRGNLLNGER